MTNKELEKTLIGMKVEIPKRAKKDELEKLLKKAIRKAERDEAKKAKEKPVKPKYKTVTEEKEIILYGGKFPRVVREIKEEPINDKMVKVLYFWDGTREPCTEEDLKLRLTKKIKMVTKKVLVEKK